MVSMTRAQAFRGGAAARGHTGTTHRGQGHPAPQVFIDDVNTGAVTDNRFRLFFWTSYLALLTASIVALCWWL
jgi:hypothetical protein